MLQSGQTTRVFLKIVTPVTPAGSYSAAAAPQFPPPTKSQQCGNVATTQALVSGVESLSHWVVKRGKIHIFQIFRSTVVLISRSQCT